MTKKTRSLSSLPPEALSEMDFLLDANSTRVGNLDFRATPDDPEPPLEPPHFKRLEEVLDTASWIETGCHWAYPGQEDQGDCKKPGEDRSEVMIE